MYLIPAIRSATREADQLLQDLDELACAAADAVGVMATRVGSIALDSHLSVAQFCAAIEAFCSATLKRIEREERDLFPVARAVISGEAWFKIANAMLAHDAYVQDCKPSRHPQPLLIRAQGAAPEPDAHAQQAVHFAHH